MKNKSKLRKIATIFFTACYIFCVGLLVQQALTPGNESSQISNSVGNQLNQIITNITKPQAEKVAVTDISVSGYLINGQLQEITGEQITLNTGDLITVQAEALPTNATNRSISYSASGDILTILQDGSITANASGECILTISSQDNQSVTKSIKITVSDILPTQLIIENQTDLLYVGQTHLLKCNLLPQNTTDQTLVYNSNNPQVLTVDGDGSGLLTAIAVGQATVTVSSSVNAQLSESFLVTVENMPESVVYAESVDVTLINQGDSENFFVHQQVNLTATVSPANATQNQVVWSSSNLNVATITQLGEVTFKEEGEVTIFATSEDGKAKKGITFKVYNRMPENLLIKSESVEITQGEFGYECEISAKSKIKITGVPSGNQTTINKISYQSTNPQIATVNAQGNITALSEGEVQIVVSCTNGLQSLSETLYLKVTKAQAYLPVSSILLTEYLIEGQTKEIVDGKISLKEEQEFDLYPTLLPANATSLAYIITSSDQSVVKVLPSGKIKTLKYGQAILTICSDDEFSDAPVSLSVSVTVEKTAVESLQILSHPTELDVGESLSLSVQFTPVLPSVTQLKWVSSNPSVLTVDEKGLVTAVSEGSAIITVSSVDNPTAFVSVSITASYLQVMIEDFNLYVSKTLLSRREQLSIQVSEFIPQNTDFKGINWYSSNQEVLTVSEEGVITALKAGDAQITAVSNVNSLIKKTIAFTVEEVLPAEINITTKGLSSGEGDELLLKVNKSGKINASIDKNATVKTINYSSSNLEVLSVDENGNLRGLKAGKATVTVYVTDGNKQVEKTIVVVVKPLTFEDTKENFSLWVRKTFGHFGAFFVLGSCASLMFLCYSKLGLKSKGIFFAVCMVSGFAVAGLTEILQLPIFTAGRYCSFTDVIIDFTGYSIATVCIFVLAFAWEIVRIIRVKKLIKK